jgi:hypothetical protein
MAGMVEEHLDVLVVCGKLPPIDSKIPTVIQAKGYAEWAPNPNVPRS